MMVTDNILFAFLLTLIAGLSTGIGASLAFFTQKTNTKLLSFSLGFSGGVMIYVSFVEILDKSKQTLIIALGDTLGQWIAVLAFFCGILLITLIDKWVPEFENPHEIHHIEELNLNDTKKSDSELYRMGLFSAIAIAIHNFPEGLATFMAAISDVSLGISIAIAIAIHNIPEGIAVAIPIYYSTNNVKKAVTLSVLSGLAEPLGALIGFFILLPFLNDIVLGIVFAMVAGIMVFIALDELLPTARVYGEPHLSAYGVILGMGVMAVSLLIL